MDGRAIYDHASKYDIRAAFRTWVAARSAERDGPGVAAVNLERTPRYRFWLFANRDVTNSSHAAPWTDTTGDSRVRHSNTVLGYSFLLDRCFDKHPLNTEPEPGPDEDDAAAFEAGEFTYDDWRATVLDEYSGMLDIHDRTDAGFAYVRLRGLGRVHHKPAADTVGCYRFYCRPPFVYPDGRLVSEA